MKRLGARVLVIALAGVVSTAPSVARAQLSAQDKAVADTFFDEGIKLLRAGKFADACPKLAESERIEPAVGTALYLGDCYERIGKIASAQAMFQEGYDFAKRRGDTRAAVAKEHHDKLTPSTLTITIAPGARVDGLQIRRDDRSISLIETGVALPSDGGPHVIVASAPGKKTFTTSINVPIKDGAVTVAIPVLVDEAKTIVKAPVDTPAPTQPSGLGTRRVVAIATFGAGVAGIIVGSIGGLVATLDWNASNSTDNGCNSGTTACTTLHGVDLRASAQSWATVSTVGFVAGGVLAVAGAVLYFTAPKSRSASAWTIAPMTTASGGGVVFASRF